MRAESVMLWWQLCNRSLGVHEPRWTSHVKRPCDVALSYSSSAVARGNLATLQHRDDSMCFFQNNLLVISLPYFNRLDAKSKVQYRLVGQNGKVGFVLEGVLYVRTIRKLGLCLGWYGLPYCCSLRMVA